MTGYTHKSKEPDKSLLDSFFGELAARYWPRAVWIIVLGVGAGLAGVAVDFHHRLNVVEDKLKHLQISKPFVAVYGISDMNGENRHMLGSIKVEQDIFEAELGPVTEERPTVYIELPPGRILTKIENNMIRRNITHHWIRIQGTQVWYLDFEGSGLKAGFSFPLRFTSTLVQ